jgi:predicted nucleic acid-binding protein
MIVLLDTGVAGLLAHPAPKSEVESWLVGLIQRGRSVLLPEIVDYELRRELLRARLATSLHALNSLPELGCGYLPLGTAAMRAAAEFWAQLRQGGEKNKSNKAENGKGIEGALGPGGLRGRVFVAAHGETEGGTPGPGGPLDRRVPHGRARWTCLTLSVSQPEAARAGQWWVGG